MAKSRAYLDWNASAPISDMARQAMLAALDVHANASSVHAEGRAARRLVEDARGEVAAGLLIHEGQLTYADEGVNLALDLGIWWGEETGGLPLPLGGNAIRRDLDPELQQKVSSLLRQSIAYALENREKALAHSIQFARGLETDYERADEFVDMYVNARTLDYGPDGQKAVRLFLDKGFEAGILPRKAEVEFVN